MQTRQVANMTVSAIGFGCMGMSEFYGAIDEAQSLATLEAACAAGVTLFDSADSYGIGHNEELLGRFLKGKRSQVQVATKFGLVRRAGSYERRVDNSPEYIRQACEASLRRLGIDCIDLYYIHRLNLEQTPLEDSLGALARLVEQGKVRHIGLCEVAPHTLRRAAALQPIAAVQSEYSLWTRDPEQGVLAAAREVGAAFFAYSPLGRGFLTGTIDEKTQLDAQDFRRFNPRFAPDNLAHNLRIVAAVRALAAQKGCSPAQLALAWLLARGEDIIPIPGTRRMARLQENLGALQVTLSAADMARIDFTLPLGVAAGERYTGEGMKGVNT
jgi:aryl-alcohol dehydrogenase-like predicted oxidoreductase